MSNFEQRPVAPRRPRPSVFWPIMLILGGVGLLLSNLGYLPEPSWAMASRLWPVIFIALGIDLLIGRRSVAGAVISALLILMLAAGVMGLIFFARYIPALGELARGPVLQSYTFEHPLAGIERAALRLDWSSQPGALSALEDSDQLLKGVITTYGTLDFTVDQMNAATQVRLDTHETAPRFNFRPGGMGRDEPWVLRLNPEVRWDVDLDGGSGAFDFDLTGLPIEAFKLDGGSGAIELLLPATGSFEGRIEGGSGAIDITAPQDVGLRILLDSGSGAFLPSARFTRVEGDDDESVWESEGYAEAEIQIVLRIGQGSGGVRVR